MGDRSYYMDTVKFIRDLVHGYVYLTKFDLKLIDTPEFQRLKDVRQLTCQNIYASARHTRFEHSLGVMEMTRQAVKNLNRNGIVSIDGIDPPKNSKPIFDEGMQFNAALAALLHDVGHCPFSHLGEIEFDRDEVWNRLLKSVRNCRELCGSKFEEELRKIDRGKRPGAVHEQMSCIVILEKFHDVLADVEARDPAQNNGPRIIYTDFELIIRCIIGYQYDVSNKVSDQETFKQHQKKNVIVNLINSSILDMDKLDYIMRDSLMTGIDNPSINTHRLFQNMYINNEVDYTLVFTNRAEPVLQNMIEARDNLYRYVYNHHAAVFSDFMYSYIFRRLDHNAEEFQNLVQPVSKAAATQDADAANVMQALGAVSKERLFSPEVILDQGRSDGDMTALLHDIHYELSRYHFDQAGEEEPAGGRKKITEQLARIQARGVNTPKKVERRYTYAKVVPSKILRNMSRVYTLIDKYERREFLKPWWKTNYEFTNFLKKNFRDDHVRDTLCKWICQGSTQHPKGDEFRSQLAKHVISITKRFMDITRYREQTGLMEELRDGDFFVIERTARFYEPESIRKLDVVLKNSAILGSPRTAKASSSEYYVKELTQISPQRKYYEIYLKNSFHIFSKPLPEKLPEGMHDTPSRRSRHYHFLEKVFVFVATRLVIRGERDFRNRFENGKKEEIDQAERDSKDEIFQEFLQHLHLE